MRSFLLFSAVLATAVDSFSAPKTVSRRDIFTETVKASSAVGLVFVANTPPAQAVSGVKKVNAKLQGLGLPAVSSIPSGFQPLLEYYGKGKNRTPLLVTFSHPITWVVTLPSNDMNGEDGTIQAGDYGKGDTATFYVYDGESVKQGAIANQPKELFENALKRSISQRGDNMYQNFKVTKLDTSSNDYVIADFKYQLLTGAGFEVDRKGVAALTAQGSAIQVLWAASTANRFKKTEPVLRDIVGSFRCYSEGIGMSEELVSNVDV